MVKKGTCGLCQGGCAVVYTIENGKIVKAEPDKESPKGRLCPRGALVPDILYGEERIKRPLIRVLWTRYFRASCNKTLWQR